MVEAFWVRAIAPQQKKLFSIYALPALAVALPQTALKLHPAFVYPPVTKSNPHRPHTVPTGASQPFMIDDPAFCHLDRASFHTLSPICVIFIDYMGTLFTLYSLIIKKLKS